MNPASTAALTTSMSASRNRRNKNEFLATCQEPNIDHTKEAKKLDKAKQKILKLKSYKKYKTWFPIWIILIIILCVGGIVVFFYPVFYNITHDSIEDVPLPRPQFIGMMVSGGIAMILGSILSYFQPRFVFRIYHNQVISIYRGFINIVYINHKKISTSSEKSFSINWGKIKIYINIYRYGYRIQIGKEKLKNKRFGQYY